MYIALFIILLLLGCLYLIATKPLHLSFVLDSEKTDLHMKAKWLSFLQVNMTMYHYKPKITIQVFKKKFTFKRKKKPGGKGFDGTVITSLSLKNTHVKTFYGFTQPHLSGILYGALCFIGSMMGIESFELLPEMFTERNYLRVEAEADLYLGKTIYHLLEEKSKRRKANGSAKLIRA